MKGFFALSLLLSFSSAFASSSDVHSVIVQDNKAREAFALKAEATRTEYREETVLRTCYREVFSGYETVCDSFKNFSIPVTVTQVGPHPDPGPHPDDPGREDKPTPRDPSPPARSCYSQAVYRTESYSCYETVSVPYQVFDHFSFAKVNVVVAPAANAKAQSENCSINFFLTGDNLTAGNSCPSSIAMGTSTVSGERYEKNYDFKIKLYDAQSVLLPLAGNLAEMKVNGDELVVKTGALSNTSNFSLKLYVQRRKFLSKDVVLINRVLTSKEFSFKALDEKTGLVHISLSKLMNFEEKRKNVITLSLDVSLPEGTLIANSAMPSLHQEATVTINK